MPWFSLAGLIPQSVELALLLRKQDPTRLFDEGEPPLPIRCGVEGCVLDNAGLVELFRPKARSLRCSRYPVLAMRYS